MDKEIEIKFLLGDPIGYRQRLIKQAAELVDERVFELNLRFDTAGKTLTQSGQVLRLRKDRRARITYKRDGHLENDVLVRTELETEVADFEVMRRVLEALGYEVFTVYEKYRETFTLDGVTVSIDEMPYGAFTELEGPSASQIHDVAKKLGLRWEKGIPSSYIVMFEQLKERLGLKMSDLSFEAFEGIAVSPEDFEVETAD